MISWKESVFWLYLAFMPSAFSSLRMFCCPDRKARASRFSIWAWVYFAFSFFSGGSLG